METREEFLEAVERDDRLPRRAPWAGFAIGLGVGVYWFGLPVFMGLIWGPVAFLITLAAAVGLALIGCGFFAALLAWEGRRYGPSPHG
jgi:hypothetical protein